MIDLELSFQFPMKREGASPVVAAASVAAGSEAIGSADASVEASTEGLAAGAASSFSLPEFEITIAPRRTTPTRTARRVLLDDPWRGVADGAGALAAGFGAAGVVETFTRAELVEGTGGMTTADVDAFFAVDFFTVFLAAAFLTVFFATAFLATFFVATFLADFFATDFLAVVFFAGDFLTAFLAVVFFATFFGAAFLAAVFFFTATVYLLEL